MKYPMHMSPEDSKKLEYEVVSDDLKIYLTRMIERWAKEEDSETALMRKNMIINKSRTIAGEHPYILTPDDMGDYFPQEYAWHNGELCLVLRRLDTPQLAELLSELVNDGFFNCDELNELLEKDGVSFRFHSRSDETLVKVMSLDDIAESESAEAAHPNIRLLVSRMDTALEMDDYSGVLHSSASIFETLAKIVVGMPAVKNQTLKSFFDRYRQDSNLPEEILNSILKTYEDRNVTPLAGHGSTSEPTLTREQAVVLAEMTKAFVKIEYRLSTKGVGSNV